MLSTIPAAIASTSLGTLHFSVKQINALLKRKNDYIKLKNGLQLVQTRIEAFFLSAGTGVSGIR